jgi:hypothetical protein
VSLNDPDVLAKISDGDSEIQKCLASSVIELLHDSRTKVLDASKAIAGAY